MQMLSKAVQCGKRDLNFTLDHTFVSFLSYRKQSIIKSNISKSIKNDLLNKDVINAPEQDEVISWVTVRHSEDCDIKTERACFCSRPKLDYDLESF